MDVAWTEKECLIFYKNQSYLLHTPTHIPSIVASLKYSTEAGMSAHGNKHSMIFIGKEYGEP